ncbi:hypothetical protein BJP27_24495 (plasmid) [Pseudomonas oryzihabitans]|nr:hypothetical protein BJP27_23845 [Pseudomonas psychrotolerans]APQ14732.1 hypothetical protein BJP27_24495 [Pseudomonas psychrotolerans]
MSQSASARNSAKAREKLSDSYIRRQIKAERDYQPGDPITPERIEAKRRQIAGRRAYREAARLGLPSPDRVPASVLRELVELRQLHQASRAYFERFLQDEAADRENCISDDQHELAAALRDVLAAVRESEIQRGAFKAIEPPREPVPAGGHQEFDFVA